MTTFRKAFGTVGYAPNVGVLGFSGVAADPEGPIQQNSYSQRAGVEGGSVDFTGTAGVSLNHVGVYGQVEDQPPVPAGFRAGVLGGRGRSRASSGSRATATASKVRRSRAPPFAPCRSSAPACRAFPARATALPAFPARRDRRRPATCRPPPACSAVRTRKPA